MSVLLEKRSRLLPVGLVLVALARCVCQASGAPCELSSDCLDSEVCSERLCRTACNSSADCVEDEICIDGACLPTRDVPGGDASLPDAATSDHGVADTLRSDSALLDAAQVDTTRADVSRADTAAADTQATDHTATDSSGGVDAQRDDRGMPDTTTDAGPRGIGDPCLADVECGSRFCHPDSHTCQVPTCWGNAANFDTDNPALDFSIAVDLSGCSPTINTSLPPDLMFSGWCGPRPAPVVQPQTGGPSIVVVPMASLLVGAGQTLRLIGDKPVVLAVRGDATIHGTIDAGARGTTPGAGGDLSTDGAIATAGGSAGTGDCSDFAAGTGQGGNLEPGLFSVGGGGAGFRTNGGFGGGERLNFRCYSNHPSYTLVADGYECKPICPDSSCDNSFSGTTQHYPANNGAHYEVAPVYGLAAPDQSLAPLRGGCAGGRGETRDSNTAYYGGSGGGAVQLTVTGALSIGTGGIVSAGGGGGTVVGSHGSGSGGGSGGAILLEATVVDISAAAGIRAHGGSGGGREGSGSCTGTAENGHLTDDDYATHSSPAGCVSEGRGGISYWDVGNLTCNGAEATIESSLACTMPITDWPTSTTAYPQAGAFTDNNGGGGGGGSGGVIIVRRLTDSGSCP